jgi:predicted Zn-dependent peptidase
MIRFLCRNWSLGLLVIGLIAGATPPAVAAQPDINVNEFRLSNGMLFLVVERHATPQIACRLSIRAGSALESAGKTGIAHMLEHMLFKGTGNFGATDPVEMQQLQDKIEAAHSVIHREMAKREPDLALIEKKREEMTALRQASQTLYIPQVFSSQLSRNGAVGINAFTSQDQTQYIASLPSDMAEQWFSIISEQVFEPAWREFYVEREVVKREWAYRYVNNPEGAAWQDLWATAFTAHPYRNPVIGWKSDIERFRTQDAIAFHNRFYTPNNAVCVLVGDITVAEAKRLARIYFDRYPQGTPAPEIVTREPEQSGPRKRIRILKGARTPLVRIGYHGARMGTKDFYALDALTMVLSHGRSARYNRNLVEKGLAVNAWAYNPDNRFGNLVILGGSPHDPPNIERSDLSSEDKEKAYEKACAALEKQLELEIDKLRTEPVSETELAKIKKLNQKDFLQRLRSNENLAGTLATLEVQTGWRYLTTYLDHMAQITPEDILAVAEKYFQDRNKNTVYLIPGGPPSEPPVTYSEVRSFSASATRGHIAPADFSNHSNYATPENWRHPLSFQREPKVLIYPEATSVKVNGAQVFFLEDRELPLVEMRVYVKAGTVDIAEEKAGLEPLLEEMLLRGGTIDHAPETLLTLLDENAIEISASIGEEMSHLTLSVMREDLSQGMALLAEILSRPRFDIEVFDVVKSQQLTHLQRENEDAQTVAMRESLAWHFKGHPYGRNPIQRLITIPAITVEDMRSFLSTYFVPSNMVVAVSGDIGLERSLSSLKSFFDALPSTEAPKRRLAEPLPSDPVLTFIHKPGQVQTNVSLTLPGLRRTNPLFWKSNLLMQIFGGNDSLMYTRLRDDLGLVYSAGFYQSYRWEAGLLRGYAGCRADQTAEAIAETIAVMRGLHEEIPENEFKLKQLDALNSFVFNVDSPAQLTRVYSLYYLRQEPLNTLEKIQRAFMSATRSELQQLAVDLLRPEKLQLFVVGDKNHAARGVDGQRATLETSLQRLADDLGLTYRMITLQ